MAKGYRYARNTTLAPPKVLSQKIEEKWDDILLDKQLIKDLSKVSFDWENYSIDEYPELGDDWHGMRTMWVNGGNFAFVGCSAGGDWEYPVHFILYLDNKGKLRGYIPEKGNTYNKATNEAFGNDEDADLRYYKKVTGDRKSDYFQVSDGDIFYDINDLKNDIRLRIAIA